MELAWKDFIHILLWNPCHARFIRKKFIFQCRIACPDLSGELVPKFRDSFQMNKKL